MMLFIDKVVARFPKGLCIWIGVPCVLLSILYLPHKAQWLYVEGVISQYIEERKSTRVRGMGFKYYEYYYIVVDSVIVGFPICDDRKFERRKEYWKEKLEGKYAKVYYSPINNDIRHIEIEGGCYSYHDPHEVSYYDIGWFPICIFAPIALFCIFVLLRYFYLLTFASDERRVLVFGNKDGDL
ncbi:MAG: hypothetical protein J6Y72_02570 [Bacteroidales bacterium]|nr:hypothetical protein [Bacteroidales bacterium]